MTKAVTQKRILVIDDDEFIQKLLEDTLSAEGFEVILAGSAEETYKILQKNMPDLMVIDIILPGQNGFELCQELREKPETTDMPILILSSRHTVSDRVKGLQFGADDYLVKPFHLEELVARVQALLRRNLRDVQSTPVEVEPAQKTAISKDTDSYDARKQMALGYFRETMFAEALQLWEDLFRESPKDLEVKKYIEIAGTKLMKKYLDVLVDKSAIPVRTSDRPEDFIGLDFNTEEGFIFSRIDGYTSLKGIVAISGMKPLKAYGILYNFCKSGVVKIKNPQR